EEPPVHPRGSDKGNRDCPPPPSPPGNARGDAPISLRQCRSDASPCRPAGSPVDWRRWGAPFPPSRPQIQQRFSLGVLPCCSIFITFSRGATQGRVMEHSEEERADSGSDSFENRPALVRSLGTRARSEPFRTRPPNDTVRFVRKVLPCLVRPPILCEPVGRCN